MLNHRDNFTKKDIELLTLFIEKCKERFALAYHVSIKDISMFNQSNLAVCSRLFYYYLMQDCTSDDQKVDRFTHIDLDAYADQAVKVSISVINSRNSILTNGINFNDELPFTIECTLNFYLNLIKPYSKMIPSETLMADLFLKFFKEALGLLRMLNLDLSSEAYSNWRTLHEAECVIKLLVEGGKPLQDVYYRHLIYNSAFRKGIPSKEETDKIFVELKGNMVKHGLKSKDMKKYIEYGWLYACKTYDESDVVYKLNFRDGLQRAARLQDYSEYYEMASEFAHSSPIFFYSNDAFLSDLTSCQLSDIILRAITYFDKYYKEQGLEIGELKTQRNVIVSNLKALVAKEDDSFYTKYKNFLVDEDTTDEK